MAGVLHNGGITDQKVPEHQSSQSSDVNGTIALVGVNLVPLSWLLFSPGLNLTEILFHSFALVGS